MDEQELYNIVTDELHKDIYDEELWQKALSDNEGDVERAKAEYIEMRVAQLKSNETEPQKTTVTGEREMAPATEPSRKPIKLRNQIIGVAIILLMLAFAVLLGYLLHDYFN